MADGGDANGHEHDGSTGTDTDGEGGTYTLLIRLAEPATVAVGALGDHALAAGWYAYTGNALGPGGFARVARHRRVASGDRDVRHWHVDYLLGHPAAALEAAVTSPGLDAECAVARAVEGERVPGFGVSDCSCRSHLAFAPERDRLERSVGDAHATHRSA
ncbi:DUF123 domain-containing protein [Halobacteriales archaeon QS_1_68_17]|nr:MAG: DUF123 domain-containing protein [Halobacteriales archaeon QS_1_68_17]